MNKNHNHKYSVFMSLLIVQWDNALFLSYIHCSGDSLAFKISYIGETEVKSETVQCDRLTTTTVLN